MRLKKEWLLGLFTRETFADARAEATVASLREAMATIAGDEVALQVLRASGDSLVAEARTLIAAQPQAHPRDRVATVVCVRASDEVSPSDLYWSLAISAQAFPLDRDMLLDVASKRRTGARPSLTLLIIGET